jgi:hypothetical protein
MIWSASTMVESRWAMTRVVRPGLHLAQGLLDRRLGGAVQRAGGFVEDQDPRVGEQSARDPHALALAAGELQAALADHGRHAVGQAVDEGPSSAASAAARTSSVAAPGRAKAMLA